MANFPFQHIDELLSVKARVRAVNALKDNQVASVLFG